MAICSEGYHVTIKKQKPVYFLIQCSNLGGMERSTLEEMIELKRMGLNVFLFSITPMGQLKKVLEEEHIPYCDNEYKGPFGLLSLPSLWLKIFRLSPGIIVAVGHNLSLFLALFLQRHKTPLLSIHYHHEGVLPKFSWKVIYAIAWFRFAHIRFVSKYIMDEAINVAPLIKNKSTVLCNSFTCPSLDDRDTQRKQFRDRFGIPESAFVVGNAGWFIQRKRWDIFLEVTRAAAEFREIHVVLAGEGPQKEVLKNQARHIRNNRTHVHFVGWLSDMSHFYNSVDVVVFNSDVDALGRTPVEAMSYGKKVIASVIKGGAKEMFPQEGGLLLGQHDVERMAKKIIVYHDLFRKQNDCLEQREGRAFIGEYLNPKDICKQLYKLLEIQ